MTSEKLLGDLLKRGLELLGQDEQGQSLLRELGASLIKLGTPTQEVAASSTATPPPALSVRYEEDKDEEDNLDYTKPVVYFDEEDLPDFDFYRDIATLNVAVLDELLSGNEHPSDTLRNLVEKNVQLHRELGAYFSLHRLWVESEEERGNVCILRAAYQAATSALGLLEYYYFEPEGVSKELVIDIAAVMAMLRVAVTRTGRFNDHVQKFMFATLLSFVKRESIYVADYMRRDFDADPSEVAVVGRRIETAYANVLTRHSPETRTRAVTEKKQAASVQETFDFLAGQRVVLIGGEVYNHVFERLEQAFQCNLIWCEVSKTGFKNYEVSIAHQDTAIVLFATRWASHASFYEVKELCAKYGKTFVQLPGGYGVNQIAHQIKVQAAHKLTPSKAFQKVKARAANREAKGS
jgi:hypothetical protein